MQTEVDDFDVKEEIVSIDHLVSPQELSADMKARREAITCSKPVREHSEEDLGCYTVVENPRRTFYNGMHFPVRDYWEKMGQAALMIRQPCLDVAKFMRRTERALWRMQGDDAKADSDEAQFEDAARYVPNLLLHGPNGAGKTQVLSYAVHYARENDWIVLHLPQAFHWAQQSDLKKSVYHEAMVDQYSRAEDFLRSFREGYPDVVQSLTIPKDVEWGGQDGTAKKGEPLVDYLERMVRAENFMELAVDIMGLMFTALRQQTDRPVLVAVDNLNQFYDWTQNHNFGWTLLHANRLSAMYQFRKFRYYNHHRPHVMFVGAVSRADHPFVADPYDNALGNALGGFPYVTVDQLPERLRNDPAQFRGQRALQAMEGIADLDIKGRQEMQVLKEHLNKTRYQMVSQCYAEETERPFWKVGVQQLSVPEIKSFLEYNVTRCWIRDDVHSDAVYKYYREMTDGDQHKLTKLLARR